MSLLVAALCTGFLIKSHTMSKKTEKKQPTKPFFTIEMTREQAEYFQLGMSSLFHAAALPKETSEGFTSAIKEMHPHSYILLQEMQQNVSGMLIDG